MEAPYDIYLVHERDDIEPKYLGKTHTPGGALSRMTDNVNEKEEDLLAIIKHTKEEGLGHTVVSETASGNIVARTSIHVNS